ncbi:2,3-bisphosphoglycerate-dependent phosphoglycerate mutase [Hydrogenimonas cancrithermarum]|uniref:2,3-bisphosphoglycerate-dependent phosphoglycerate mutase n=1 Tax=Hydrogenimonas cancrithermarum TaxID=2993563 RepID=A0ABN6WX83_9BACT|nr:2,3-bisphosphoglycerate-dependent phosphoglycerate mutase [Hydrogenimonas cancrithermarum]BDY13871.1 2,3-bisphosphoglycerate-dependent phosphoglycerate mutase [Hydrogenimonas cancrithermarum]
MGRLILLRHGQSLYNKENLFTGWTDVDLSEEGIEEAKRAGEILLKHDLLPDICFTSWLKRAIHTAQLALKEMEWEQIDCIKSWKLNERHYGAWQCHNKDAIRKEVGDEMFMAVRRGYDTSPPPLQDGDPRLAENDPKYRKLDPSSLPRGESLKATRKRVLNYFAEAIAPELARGKDLLVSAHGNSLRALVMAIEHLTPAEIVEVEIPTGEPIVYVFDETLHLLRKERPARFSKD